MGGKGRHYLQWETQDRAKHDNERCGSKREAGGADAGYQLWVGEQGQGPIVHPFRQAVYVTGEEADDL